MLATGNDELLLCFAFLALQPERHLLGRLRLRHDGSFQEGKTSKTAYTAFSTKLKEILPLVNMTTGCLGHEHIEDQC